MKLILSAVFLLLSQSSFADCPMPVTQENLPVFADIGEGAREFAIANACPIEEAAVSRIQKLVADKGLTLTGDLGTFVENGGTIRQDFDVYTNDSIHQLANQIDGKPDYKKEFMNAESIYRVDVRGRASNSEGSVPAKLQVTLYINHSFELDRLGEVPAKPKAYDSLGRIIPATPSGIKYRVTPVTQVFANFTLSNADTAGPILSTNTPTNDEIKSQNIDVKGLSASYQAKPFEWIRYRR